MLKLFLEAGDRIVERPTSSRCGARTALYLRKKDGMEVSLGCACHHDLVLTPRVNMEKSSGVGQNLQG